jgi:cell wall-associated NlpC family hydrolase
VADGSYRPGRILLTLCLLTLCTAAAATFAVTPVSHADPQPTMQQVERKVGDLYHKAEQATERYNDARVALADAEREFARAQSRVSAQQAEMAEKQEMIGAIAVSAYRSGGVDESLKLLFSENPQQFLQRASALDVLSHQQADDLREVVEARRALNADKLAAAHQLAAVERIRKQLAAEKATVERNLRAAQEQLNSLRAADRRRLAERASRNQDRMPINVPVSGRAGAAVKYAYNQLGDRYQWAAAGPDAFDCSGLTMMAWRQAGVSLPHSSKAQYDEGTKVSRSQLAPGDLVFFYSPISHVGIYIGGGKMIHAPNPSERVKIDPISSMPFTGATRP